MKSDFELSVLNLLLKKLLSDSVIKNEEQKKKLYEIYFKDKRKFSEIYKEITVRLVNDKEFLENKLKENEKINGKNVGTVDIKKKVEYPLSLENITDFTKNGRNYIKIHYPAPIDKVRIIENMTDPYKSGKEIFEGLKDTQKKMSLDGVSNATSIFEQVLIRDCIEVKVRDIEEVSTRVEYSKLSAEEQEVVYGTLKSIIASLNVSDEIKVRLNRENIETIFELIDEKIYISPKDNIIVICTPNEPSKDSVRELKYSIENGIKKYMLNSLDGNGYRYNEEGLDNNDLSENDPYETPSDDKELKDNGTSLKPVPPWKKRKKGQAAFISVLWFSIFLGVLTGIVSIISIIMLLNK